MYETPSTIQQWCMDTFGNPTPVRIAVRANQEMAELLVAAGDDDMAKVAEEAADVVICFYQMARVCGFDLKREVQKKMEVNRERRWDTDGRGTGYHVKDT